jgi:hypothetical protein
MRFPECIDSCDASNAALAWTAGGKLPLMEIVDTQYMQAAQGTLRQITLDFSPAAEISSACARIFSLVDRDDDQQRRIARNAWIIKSTILQTMLEFDDPRLGFNAMAQTMRDSADAVAAIASPTDTLVRLMDALVATPRNPKRDWFLAQIAASSAPGLPAAILVRLQGAGTPGWPAALTSVDDFGDDSVALVRTRKDIRNRVFGKVVIPGTMKFTARPLVNDILYGGRSADLIVLAYSAEKIYIPQPIVLPADRTFAAAGLRKLNVTALKQAYPVDPIDPIDNWANESIWEELRSRYLDVAPLSDKDVSVAARFVLFADGSGAFLPEEKSVVEISDFLNGGRKFEISEERLPRKCVRDLEEHDLVMLRLSGSGDYLDDVADSLMAREGLGSLRIEATAWKPWLNRVIRKHGEGIVAKAGKDFGLRLRSATYIWAWAGETVIAPQDFDTFRALIATLVHLDPTAISAGTEEYAYKRWQQMEQVKAFHFRAGAAIRTALLQRVKSLVADRVRVETVESIELPGVEAGRMGLLRVSAVDAKPVRIPQSRLFHVFPLKEH